MVAWWTPLVGVVAGGLEHLRGHRQLCASVLHLQQAWRLDRAHCNGNGSVVKGSIHCQMSSRQRCQGQHRWQRNSLSRVEQQRCLFGKQLMRICWPLNALRHCSL
jgi:hypothetical protein